MGRWLPAVLLLAVACGRAAPPAAEGPTVDRIVTLAPSATETVFALGLGELVVGVDDYSHWPAEVAGLPRLGGLFDPNLEAIATLEPGLAIVLPSQRELGERLRGLGIDVLEVPSETLADVGDGAVAIAERCGLPGRGRLLADRLRRELEPQPLDGRPRVALVVGRQPGRLASVLVAGPGTYLDELLGRLGAVNVFADTGQTYPQVGLEAFLERRPQAIVELHGEPLVAGADEWLRRDWREAPGLKLPEACVAVIDGHEVLVPGPRLPEVYRRLRAALEACG